MQFDIFYKKILILPCKKVKNLGDTNLNLLHER